MTEAAGVLATPASTADAAWAEERARLAATGQRWPTLLPGIALGIAGTLVAVGSGKFPGTATALQFLLLAVVSAAGLSAVARTRSADWWLAALIVILAMFPNSEINPDLRIVAGGFRIFLRLVVGVASPWDLLLFTLFVLALWMHYRGRLRTRILGRSADVFLIGLACIYAAGILNGLIHAWILAYGPSNFRGVVQQSLPIFYLFASVLVGRLAIVEPASVWKVLWAVRLSTVAVLVQGTLLLLLAMRGDFSVLRGFLGIPIVLYDQLTILNVAVLLLFARYAAGLKLRFGDWLILTLSLLFILLSTRRLVLVMLVINLALVFVLAVRRGQVMASLVRTLAGVVAVLALVLSLASVVVPTAVEAIGLVVRSVDLTSEVGLQKGGALRLVEAQNLAQNLGSGLTPSWIIGRGVGTYWQEFVPTELALDVGSAAFVESQLEAGAQGWWPNFHLPYVALLYRFGVLGTAVIWCLVIGWFLRWRVFMRGLSSHDRPFAVVVVVLMISQLVGIGESTDSAGPAFLGFLFAALGGMRPRAPEIG